MPSLRLSPSLFSGAFSLAKLLRLLGSTKVETQLSGAIAGETEVVGPGLSTGYSIQFCYGRHVSYSRLKPSPNWTDFPVYQTGPSDTSGVLEPPARCVSIHTADNPENITESTDKGNQNG